ncbi:MAG: S8 family serine peptidase, partial [Bifidobacteriaceae bacterium]|nr:S8 family serine peptidase [Bifidobacteriaceae bacterium]
MERKRIKNVIKTKNANGIKAAVYAAVCIAAISLTVGLINTQLIRNNQTEENTPELKAPQSKAPQLEAPEKGSDKTPDKKVDKPVDSKYEADGVDYHTAVLTIDKNASKEKIVNTLKPYFSDKNINLAFENLGNLKALKFNPTVSISAKTKLSDSQFAKLKASNAFVRVNRDIKVEFTNYTDNPNDKYNLEDEHSYGLRNYNEISNAGSSSFATAWTYLGEKFVADKNVAPVAVLDSAFLPSADGESENIIAKCDFGEGAADCSKKTVAPSPDANPSSGPNHGTTVSHIISAKTDNKIGGMGASFDSIVYFYKISNKYGAITTDGIKNAIYQAVADGAKVINMSFGAPCDSCNSSGSDSPWGDALDYAHENGVTLVASAGNARASANYTCHKMVPAMLDIVIGVAALDAEGKPSWFSNCNDNVNVTAAGDNVRVRTNPRQLELDEDWGVGSGTSYSGPLVAAAASLVLRANPALAPNEVKDVLEKTAHDVKKKTGIENDICNVEQGTREGWDPCTGWGIIDAAAAIERVANIEKLPFSDIREYGDKDSIVWAYKKGIIAGYTCTGLAKPYAPCKDADDKVFLPHNGLIRGNFVSILYRLKGSPAIDESWRTPFVDIKGSFAEKEIIWAYNAGITSGTDKTHFSPTKTVNRLQGLIFLHNLAGNPKVKTKAPFEDIASDSFAYNAANWAYNKGIFTGYNCTAYM